MGKLNKAHIAGHFSRGGAVLHVSAGYMNSSATPCTPTKPCIVLSIDFPGKEWSEIHIYISGPTARRIAKELKEASKKEIILKKKDIDE